MASFADEIQKSIRIHRIFLVPRTVKQAPGTVRGIPIFADLERHGMSGEEIVSGEFTGDEILLVPRNRSSDYDAAMFFRLT